MSFNLGIANHPTTRLGMSSVGVYLYEDIYYRQWITEIALAFYEGRQDEFIWLDLVRQFRNPEKQQIWPLNLTKEIIDETSILYREAPIYQVVDENGKQLSADQDLWDDIMENCRYSTFMDKLDRWTKLLGTVLVKVSFVDPKNGQLVNSDQGGQVHLDMLHGGVYDIKHGASPYYITELMIGFGNKFGGFGNNRTDLVGGSIAGNIPSTTDLGQASIEVKQSLSNPGKLGAINSIYWSPETHVQTGTAGKYETKNPYGVIPAVPFFNQDPAHYYFLPIDEPLIYANHAVNMRITDLNHIAKFQSFGVPVVTGVERPTSTRQGRPVDDFNVLKGGSAQSKFGGVGGNSGFGAGGQFRTFDGGLGLFRDGNADANALGVSIGPDTAIALGEKGDFKFAHPSADITGLLKVIENMTDMVRVSHGLRPKFKNSLPPSGFAQMLEKMGVMEANIRRGKLFKEREQQLFQVIKTLYNTHNAKSGSKRFSDKARLAITYIPPEFPLDPKTKMDAVAMEEKLLAMGDRQVYKKLHPWLSDADINKLIAKKRKDDEEQQLYEAEVQIKVGQAYKEAGLDVPGQPKAKIDEGKGKPKAKADNKKEKESDKPEVEEPKIDNKQKHAQDSSKQKGKNGDTRSKS